MTGFEPATPGPPDQCANRAAPHPEIGLQIYKKVVLKMFEK